MKLLLCSDVPRLGSVGDVVEVKPGYARNYLIPKGLAVEPNKANFKAIEAEKQKRLEQIATERTEVEAKARLLAGREVTISARANEEGHLYGSIGPAQIVAAFAEEGVFLNPENISLSEPIRQLDKYEVRVDFAHDVTATVSVWVVPIREADAEETDADQDSETSPAEESTDDSVQEN